MKNKYLLGIVILQSLVACNSSLKNKIVYLDSNILVEQYKGMEVVRAGFSKKTKLWQANVDTLISQFRNELALYEKERSKMTDREKQLKEELLGNKQQQIEQYQAATRKKAQEEEQQMMQSVLNQINDYVKEYGEKMGYEYILGVNGSGNVVYAKKENNITEEVLKGLNEEYDTGNKSLQNK